MRHDQHFVESLAAQDATPIGRRVALSSVRADPNQPRRGVGDLADLVASIKDKGVLEPVLVRPDAVDTDAFVLISGERRYRAAVEAGLFEIPAIVMDVSDEEALEIALVENLQRQDLSAFEEAEGYERLANTHGYTHERIAGAVSKSRSGVTESLSLLKMPLAVRQAVVALGIDSKSILLEVIKLEDSDLMLRVLERISARGLGRDSVRREVHRILRKSGPRKKRAQPYTFHFSPESKSYRMALSFRHSEVEPEDLIKALEEVLRKLRQEHEAEAAQDSLLPD
jgi:ParB family chromosome partitioning protein